MQIWKGKINKISMAIFWTPGPVCLWRILGWKNSSIPIPGVSKWCSGGIKNIKIPVLRWAGGCFADEYHWKDGVGPGARAKWSILTGVELLRIIISGPTSSWIFVMVRTSPYICGQVWNCSGNVRMGRIWPLIEGISIPSGEGNVRMSPEIEVFRVGNENWGWR